MPFFQKLKIRYQGWVNKVIRLTKDPDEDKYGQGWDKLGFHRPIASYLYTFGLLIPAGLFGLLLLPLLQYTYLRYPEVSAFEAAAGAIFGALYVILDLELKPTVDRFVPQYAVSNPKRAMQYVSFFVKYQMWSGLIQILFVGVFMFMFIIPYTNFAYLSWFILFINIKQYPAILSTFQSVIGSLQHGDKEQLIVFWRASVIEPLTKIGGGFLGLLWGQANPIYGEMYGLALGWSIGSYVDDFFVFGLGMYWLSKILDKYGIRMWEIYGQKIPPEVWKDALGYSMKLMPKTIFGAIMGFTSFLVTYEGLPGYMTYQGLIKEAGNLKKFVGWSDDIINKSQPSYSEAYNNGKIELTKYYIGQGLRYNSFFFMILGGFNFFCLDLILEIVFEAGFLPDTWALIGKIVPIMVILWIWTPFDDIATKMTYISGHPEINTFIGIMGSILNLFFTYYFLYILELGWLGLVLAPVPTSIISLIIRWTYMNKKIIPLDRTFWKDAGWQIFVAPLTAGAAFLVFLQITIRTIWPVLKAPFEGPALLIPGIAMLVILLLVGVMLIYIPLISYLGFWDEKSITIFKRAVSLSGPSIIIVYPMYKVFNHFYQRSPFKEKHAMKLGEVAEAELAELAEIRHQKFLEYVQEK